LRGRLMSVRDLAEAESRPAGPKGSFGLAAQPKRRPIMHLTTYVPGGGSPAATHARTLERIPLLPASWAARPGKRPIGRGPRGRGRPALADPIVAAVTRRRGRRTFAVHPAPPVDLGRGRSSISNSVLHRMPIRSTRSWDFRRGRRRGRMASSIITQVDFDGDDDCLPLFGPLSGARQFLRVVDLKARSIGSGVESPDRERRNDGHVWRRARGSTGVGHVLGFDQEPARPNQTIAIKIECRRS